MLKPIKSLTLVEQTNDQLLSFIAEQSLQAGDSLPSIAHLSETLGASRAVIRESFRNLEARGIIEVANGRRARIKPVTCEPLMDYFTRFIQVEDRAQEEFTEIRIALELQCIKLAVERGTASQLAEIQHTVSQMRRYLAFQDRFVALDMQFHLQIARATQNTMMVYLLESLRDAIKSCIEQGLSARPDPHQMESVQVVHERLVDALVERDCEKAQKALLAHFYETSKLHV
ncbi:FadR/GntR family transcriptional regulator [Teredinibacter turnerae]|uniref:FadR/GntR family transcriptional regulator n=1 Tax=Teredinibacter turnerae TaxID=2426 RepID=UPI0003828922|nr:FCD domain-containing protein [Teredinibacter turnerae]